MRINYLFSDISKEQGFNEIQREYLKKDIKNNDTIVFIATTFDDYEKNDLYYNNLIKHFKNIDITFNKAYLIDNRVAKDLAKDYILKSNIIFLMGGDTKKQIDSVKEYDLFEILKSKEGIILGVSAGSMNQSSRVVYKNDYNNYVIEDYEGLGYIDINIYPHLDFNNIDYLKEVFEVSNYTKTVALPNDSFIRIENNNIEKDKENKTENKVENQINKAEEEKIDMSDEIDTQSSQEGRAIESNGVQYRTHVQYDGWQNWKSNGDVSGTSGRSLRLEGINIKLTGDIASKVKIKYQVHVQYDGKAMEKWQEQKEEV